MRARGAALSLLPTLLVACAGGRVPDPRSAAAAFADAVQRGDTQAVYGMMTEDARRARSKQEVAALLASERNELADHARALAANESRVDAAAQLRFADGEEATLDLSGGRFYVATAGALPGGARSPEEALDQLRRVLARRSYAGLMRLLSPTTRATVEQDLRTLVLGLERPAALEVQISGDAATVPVPGGHHVRLRKDGATWRIDDFD